MLVRGILGSGRTRGVSFWPFPNSSGWWWLISSVFLTRISCHKTTHGNGYYGAWLGRAVSISVLPLIVWPRKWGCRHMKQVLFSERLLRPAEMRKENLAWLDAFHKLCLGPGPWADRLNSQLALQHWNTGRRRVQTFLLLEVSVLHMLKDSLRLQTLFCFDARWEQGLQGVPWTDRELLCLPNCLSANVHAEVQDKRLKNQISGQAKDSKATLDLNRPGGLVIQAVKHGAWLPFVLLAFSATPKYSQPQRGRLTSKENLNEGHFHQGAKKEKKTDCWLHVNQLILFNPTPWGIQRQESLKPETWQSCQLLPTLALLHLQTPSPAQCWPLQLTSRSCPAFNL